MKLNVILAICCVALLTAACCNNAKTKKCNKACTECTANGGECTCEGACTCENCACETCACSGTCTEACAKSCTKQGECPKKGNCTVKNQPIKKVIVAHFDVKPDQVKAFITAGQAVVDATRKEAGCISYALYQLPTDPTKFVMYEEWKDQAAIDSHFEQPHFKTFGQINAAMLAAPAKLQIFDISAEK